MPSESRIPATGRGDVGELDACSSRLRGSSAPKPARHRESLADFHESAGQITHMLNNLLTALYCQWDLCFPEGEPEPSEQIQALRRTVDLAALEIRKLSRECADYAPAAEQFRSDDRRNDD